MISRLIREDVDELVVTYSLLGRVFGLVIAGVHGLLLCFYFQSGPQDGLEIAEALLFFCSLILVGLSIFAQKLIINREAVEERGLFFKRRVPLPSRRTVERIRREVVIKGPSGEVVYRCDRSFNHGNRLEDELRMFFNTL